MKIVILTFLEHLWQPNLAGYLLRVKEQHPLSHVEVLARSDVAFKTLVTIDVVEFIEYSVTLSIWRSNFEISYLIFPKSYFLKLEIVLLRKYASLN